MALGVMSFLHDLDACSMEIRPRCRILTDHDIVRRFHGKISLRLAYKIMDECEEVRAGRKRLVTAESFEEYLRHTGAETTPEMPSVAPKGESPTRPSRGKSRQTDSYEFFP